MDDIKDVPEWATYLAQDNSGDWYVFQTEPEHNNLFPLKDHTWNNSNTSKYHCVCNTILWDECTDTVIEIATGCWIRIPKDGS